MVFANHLRSRITPAYAGQILLDEHSVLNIQESSPHTRDKWVSFHWSILSHGIIPAYAGQIRHITLDIFGSEDHPRIRGTNVDAGMDLTVEEGSSPHTRDKYYENPSEYQPSRIIPAYAGQIWKPLWRRYQWQDHPRIRGTNPENLQNLRKP